jgi:DNA-directed RNA polymerase
MAAFSSPDRTRGLTQDALTTIARKKGRERAVRNWKDAKERGREALTRVGNATVRQLVNGLMDLLADDLEKFDSGRAVSGGAGLKPLLGAPIGEVCLAVTRAAVNGMSSEWVSGISMQARLGAAAEDTILDAKWRKLSPQQAEAVRALVGRSNDPARRRLAKKAYANGWQREILEGGKGWDEQTTKTVGATLMQYLVRLGMLEHAKEKVGEGPRRKWTNGVRLTEKASQWISRAAEFEADSAEVQYPTVEPPIPWSAPFGGGFHGRGTLDHPSVPSSQRPFWIMRHARREHKELLKKADLSTVYAGLNAAQATGWRINPKVYAVLEELRRIGKGGGGLASADPPPKPVFPNEASADKAMRARFKAEAREYHASRLKLVSKRNAEYRVAETARLFSNNERFHFVYNVDFRGRAYACSEYLSPQGNDLQRGLLEFAIGDPLTDEGVWWLKLHLANSYGKDKESFDDRIHWATANAFWFQRIAEDPIGTVRDWEKADSPWQFLAACLAWNDYANGETLCRLPVILDGSCSGIQHSSALVADEDAGSAVNLVPRPTSERPGDIYASVAERAERNLEEREAQIDIHAHRWRREWRVTRADTKSSVMTLPYGGTKFGNLDKVRQSVEKQIKKGKKDRPDWLVPKKDSRASYNAAMKALSDAVWEAMEDIVKVPLEVMDHLKACGRALKEREAERRKEQRRAGKRNDGPNLRFAWTSPCGFPVLADYRIQKNRRTTIKDEESGKPITFLYYALTDATNWREVIDAAPPHFIHSLDASHLMRSLARAREDAGVDQVAIVHDAFGATPSKVGALARLLREEFARMYSEDVLENTLGRMLDDAGATRPPPPKRGRLDVAEIANATYLFA